MRFGHEQTLAVGTEVPLQWDPIHLEIRFRLYSVFFPVHLFAVLRMFSVVAPTIRLELVVECGPERTLVTEIELLRCLWWAENL